MDDDSFLFNDDDPAMDDLFLQALEAVDNAQQQAILITEPQVSHTKPRPPTTTSTKTTVKATAGQQTKQKQKNLFEAFGISQPATVTAPVPARTARLEKNDTKTASPLALKKFDPKNNVDDDDEFVIFDGEPSITHSTDLEAYKTWIYPINYGFRDYQFNIVRRALFSNTLVALPTGLGKTFIASVVMFNFYRWFPKGKVIFMAPTKPLVNQQVEACFGVTGLPPSETAELTGTTASHNRREIWDSKRVFFITPHVLQNDLESGCCSVDDIVLIVVDEAHRATGNYAYVEVMRKLSKQDANFRVLALTATPGSDTKAVTQVVNNLRISKIEIRTEDSMDIVPFIHQRVLDLIVVPISDAIKNIANCYAAFMSVFLKRLNDQKVHYEKDPLSVTSYSLLMSRERFRASNHGPGSRPPAMAGYIEGTFGIAMTLAQSYSLLIQHGIRTFFGQLDKYRTETLAKGTKASKASRELLNHPQFKYLMDHVPALMQQQSFSSHLKMDKLVTVVLDHFMSQQRNETSGEQTRVIIFSQFRESVEEIVTMLGRHSPIVRVMSFVGQSAGSKGKKAFTQKDQLEVISRFQSGNYNVLVSTSIGEEGLDIGQVDLIVCYDSQNSPIRMLQRMGRTGRKRQGRVVLLLAEGKEEDAYKKSQSQYKSVQNAILNGQGNKIKMYIPSYDVLPQMKRPECVKMSLDIPVFETTGKTKKASKGVASAKHNPHVESGGQSINQVLLLTSREQEEFNNEYRTLPHENAKLSLAKFTYRQVLPMPQIHLPRTHRCQDFCSLISSVETMISEEEAHIQSLPENHDIPSSSTKARTSRNTKRKSIIFNLPDEDDSIYEIRNSQYKSSPISKFHKAEALLHQSPGPQQELTEQELASRFMSSPVITHRGPARSVLTPIVPLSNSSPQIQMFDQAHSSDSLLLKAPSLKTSCEVSKDCLLQLLKSDRMESDDFGDHEMIVESQDFFQPSVTSTENALIKKADPISLKKSSQQGSLIIHTDPFDFSTQADMDLAQIDFDAFIPPMNVVKSNTPAQQPTTHHHQSVSHNNHPSQLSNSAQDTPFAKPARRKRLIVTDASSSTSRPQDVDLFQQESPLAKEIESGITRDTQGRVFVPKRTPLLERLEKRKQMRRPAPKMRCTPVVVPRRQLNTKKTEEGSKDKTRIKKKVTVNPFMELDAEWSRSEDGSSVSSDTDDDGLDANLTGFIVDSFTQEEHAPEASCIGMTQVYRTSLLSPEVGGWVTGKKARPGAYQFRAPQKDRYPVQDTQFSGAPIPDSDTPGSLADFIVEEEDTMLDVVLEEEEEELEDEAEAGISAESTRPTTGSLLQLHDLLDVSDSE